MVQQIAREQKLNLRGRQPGFVHRAGERFALEGTFRLFPAFFAHGGVLENLVKIACERSFALLFAHHGGIAEDAGSPRQGDGVLSFAFRHGQPSFLIIRTRYSKSARK